MIVEEGEDERRQELQQLARQLGIESKVVLAGFQPNPTPFYMTADLFVLSSNYEGFANVIVEALACGLPVVSTNCPSGPAEILEERRWGYLVPVGNAEALAAAIDRALVTSHDPEALRRHARDFSPEIAARRHLELLLPQ